MNQQVCFELGYQAMHHNSYLSFLPKPIVLQILRLVFAVPKIYKVYKGNECVITHEANDITDFIKILLSFELNELHEHNELELFLLHIYNVYLSEDNDAIFDRDPNMKTTMRRDILKSVGSSYILVDAFRRVLINYIHVLIEAIKLNKIYKITCTKIE